MLTLSRYLLTGHIAQNMKFSIKDFFSKYEQIRSFIRIDFYLLHKFLMKKFFACAVQAAFKIRINTVIKF